jgi:hypothetical protein
MACQDPRPPASPSPPRRRPQAAATGDLLARSPLAGWEVLFLTGISRAHCGSTATPQFGLRPAPERRRSSSAAPERLLPVSPDRSALMQLGAPDRSALMQLGAPPAATTRPAVGMEGLRVFLTA